MDVKRRKVLVVDDSDICRELVQLALEERGYDVVVLDSPLGFNRALNDERPDLALVDVCMPALAGDTLVAIAQRHRQHDCLIVLFSDRAEDELARLAGSSGAAGYIRKTGDGDLLAAAVERFLGAA